VIQEKIEGSSETVTEWIKSCEIEEAHRSDPIKLALVQSRRQQCNEFHQPIGPSKQNPGTEPDHNFCFSTPNEKQNFLEFKMKLLGKKVPLASTQ
jgi:hypothetical protein